MCGIAGSCWEYPLYVESGGARLRVALGVVLQTPGGVRPFADIEPTDPEQYKLQLLRPDRTVLKEQDSGALFGDYFAEVFIADPPAGHLTVRVVPTLVHGSAFRLRAKLEGPDDSSAGGTVEGSYVVALSPNARIVPPFEFSFNTPTASVLPGADTPGAHPSCMPEEIREAAEEAARDGEDPLAAVPKLCGSRSASRTPAPRPSGSWNGAGGGRTASTNWVSPPSTSA